MANYMYIAGSFETVVKSKCGRGKEWLDNDPHFWTMPPTWGICRNDLRRKATEGDTIIFVLPKHGKHSQMIFGYLKIKEIITHKQALSRSSLNSKKMGNKNPNGNIIVDSNGRYNRYDGGAHKHVFARVKQRYAIGDVNESRMLDKDTIEKLAPSFLNMLITITGINGSRPIDIITRYGIELSDRQVKKLVYWVNA